MMEHIAGKVRLDGLLIIAIFSLLGLGLVMVGSASMVVAQSNYAAPFHFLVRQAIYVVLGCGAMLFMVCLKTELWRALALPLLFLGVSLLIIVLLPGVGKEVNGSTRWLHLGPISLQVSELIKFCMIVYAADYLVRHEKSVQETLVGFLKPLALIGVIAIFLLLQPDFGALVVLAATVFVMLFMAKVPLRRFVVVFVIAGVGFALVMVAAPYRLARLSSFLNPWADQFNTGYQLTQSLIAFGRGGWLGVGLGDSVQKLFYLPEAHTDFLVAIVGEELGFVGVMVVVALFALLVFRGLLIARQAEYLGKKFEAYLAYGISFWVGLQAIINLGVNTGLLPTKGLTLPLMSFGGSSLVINCLALGLLLRVDIQNKYEQEQQKKGGVGRESR
ncbi:Cell division protein FtsW [Piscirickettsia salmonis]|uniref:Probable peptidoglycan glycosyltransferase FtsW n=1 Tax=Piscirickettsia salmonis TaxID=1238 RepID=A0A1L6TFN0_PISSA|nr:putative lipid II flippase FtsW [Piscirickettsia salmonis]AKP72236.2 cell division protein FtsW [Piscirickettsia salmonis LF-89 = ATCC VR-1361]ALB24326.1 cell division protein FtsW [Piscirickettsia salmonis]ALY04118.1 cell division protein FtsW [Piscirickettsia salmonis]AMA43673.1 cell division protein FtsW [Piscirickettsia salmonis]AOS36140.1 cell division protein FtsW [Piscirickettsia salmonis]